MILNFVLLFVSISVSLVGIFNILSKKSIRLIPLNFILLFHVFVFIGIIYFTIFTFSVINITPIPLALFLWKISFILALLANGILILIGSLTFEAKNKLRKFSIVFLSLIIGILSALVFEPNSIKLVEKTDKYQYLIQNDYIFIFTVFFFVILTILFWNTEVKETAEELNPNIWDLMNFLRIAMTVAVISYLIYLYTQSQVFEYLVLTFFIIGSFFILIAIQKNPFLLVALRTRIYDFILFHKSGILLFSYNFETRKETEDSVLKGSMLIGINHILANIGNRKDYLKYFRMQDKLIIFEYDNSLGYAILVIVEEKNKLIQKSIKIFLKEFNQEFGDELKELGGLVDSSKFRGTKTLIQKAFPYYFS